jgi:hypothetical protein
MLDWSYGYAVLTYMSLAYFCRNDYLNSRVPCAQMFHRGGRQLLSSLEIEYDRKV